MNSFEAFIMGEMNRDKTERVFDWDKALKILKEKKAKHAWAGLANDMEYTAGRILVEGKPVTDSYTYLASTWATPVIVITENKDDGYLDSDMIECWVYNTEKDNPNKYSAESKWLDLSLIHI